MRMALLALALASCLSACDADPIYAAEDAVRERLRDPGSAEFNDVHTYASGENGNKLVCGRVNSRNGFGGMGGEERFVAGGKAVLEEDVGHEVMDALWLKSCHDS